MKKSALLILMLGSMFTAYTLRAEESPAPQASASPSPAPATSPAAVVSAAVMPPAEPTPSTPAQAPATPVSAPAAAVTPAPAEAAVPAVPLAAIKNTENLEFVSGEITGIDETSKTLTVKLYGEAETSANDKILTIKIDDTTDITDGEKDRNIKSLTNGTEVDVEYDPATNKATYIFVY